MKKWLLIIGLSLTMVASAQTIREIAVVNIGSLFQQIAQDTGVSTKLENEFKDRANELQRVEGDLKRKIQRLQHESSAMKVSERGKLEKDVISQRQTLSQRAQAFEQDRQRRSNEERGKLITRIQNAVKSVAIEKNIDLVIDISAVAFNNLNIKDITHDVLKQIQ